MTAASETDPEAELPPPPVSSDDEQSIKEATTAQTTAGNNTTFVSRLFAPYRTVGLVNNVNDAAFCYSANTNSVDSFAHLPLGDRFSVVSTNRLEPVMVGQSLGRQAVISHVIHDATLKVTVTNSSNSSNNSNSGTKVTMWVRVSAVQHVTFKSNWKTVSMLKMGNVRVPVQQSNKAELAMVFCLVQQKSASHDTQAQDERDNDSITSSDDSDNESMNDNEQDDDDEFDDSDSSSLAHGRIVVMVATKKRIYVQKIITMDNMPDFQPAVAMHPATYLNKICIGGTTSTQGQPCMVLYNIRSAKLVHEFKCFTSLDDEVARTVTCLEQSPAVDTIAVGTSTGDVHLVNLKLDQLLFTLRHKLGNGQPTSIKSLSFRTDASALQHAIAPLAVGRDDGKITIWDLTAQDEDGRRDILTEFTAHKGGVTKLMYLPQEPLLLSTGVCSNSVLMHIFDSPDHSGRLLKSRKGHTAPPMRIRHRLPAHGNVLASTMDAFNSTAHHIMSSGGDDRTMRLFSVVRTVTDTEYSQGPGLEKRAKKWGVDTSELLLPPVLDWATCQTRSREWGDMVTIHANHAMAYVWSHATKSQSGPVLRQPHWKVSKMNNVQPPITAHATAIVMSACGNFCLVGTKGGTIYKYNVESGIPRGSYPPNLDKKDGKESKKMIPGDIRRTLRELEKARNLSNRASNLDKEERNKSVQSAQQSLQSQKLKSASHEGFAVTGIAVDSVNKTVISVGTDSKLIMWNFLTHAPHKKSPFILPCAATRMFHVQETDLAAIALSDYSVLLFDCAALSIVRRFGVNDSHNGPISDLGFSPDGRLLYTASLDRTIRVWDVPTNTCVDWLEFRTAPTSLSVSPNGEFLATTHKGRLGISVWSDRTFYQTVDLDGVTPEQPVMMDEPVPVSESSKSEASSEYNIVEIKSSKRSSNAVTEPAGPVVPIEQGLVTLSGLPQAHWKTLFHLELIKERNKPKEAPKKPPSAPFFLQWRSGEPMVDEAIVTTADTVKKDENENGDGEEEWAAAWSDAEDAEEEDSSENDKIVAIVKASSTVTQQDPAPKRQKTMFFRSTLASKLLQVDGDSKLEYTAITDYIATLGPSAIDVELGSLCRGDHDLDEGLEYLVLACKWLEHAVASKERFEAVNAYVHRFLYLHGQVIANIEETFTTVSNDKKAVAEHKDKRKSLIESINRLRQLQSIAAGGLQSKMQHTLCLLRHFCRMV